MALDGPHLDGLIGSAGMLRFDWPERRFHIQFFEGVSAAHNVSVSDDGKRALLGNFSQQIVLLDTSDPKEIGLVRRQSTLPFADSAYRLRANTHHLWYPDGKRFLGCTDTFQRTIRVWDLARWTRDADPSGVPSG